MLASQTLKKVIATQFQAEVLAWFLPLFDERKEAEISPKE